MVSQVKSDQNRTPVTPHQLDYLAAIGLALGICCAGVTYETISLWKNVGTYRNSLPASATEGSMGFSLQFHPWMLTFGCLALALVTMVILLVSFCSRRSERLSQSNGLHVATVLSLLPAGYLLFRLAVIFFR